MEDDEALAHFLEAFERHEDYPRSLVHNSCRTKYIVALSSFIDKHAPALFRDRKRAGAGFQITDYGDPAGPKTYPIDRDEQLESELGWPTTTPSSTPPRSSRTSTTIGAKRLGIDPKARFIILELKNCCTPKLSISRNALFKILTYHQVCPFYLKLLTVFPFQARENDPNVGAISCRKFFKIPGPRIPALGRSGLCFQLAFQFTSFHDDEEPGRGTRWNRYITAIYHSFDIKNATSFWIITTPCRPSNPGRPDSTENKLWQTIQSDICNTNTSSDDPVLRMEATFDVILTVADWGWGDRCFYLFHLAEKFMQISSRYVDGDQRVTATDLHGDLSQMNWWLFKLAECKLNLQANLKVLKQLDHIYRGIIECTEELGDDQPDWWKGPRCKKSIGYFLCQLSDVIQGAEDLVEKAQQKQSEAQRREDFMQKVLQNHMSRLSQREALVMRVFQFVAVIFLPATVVSTIFSTDIVKFQNLPEGRTVSFSATALWVWCVTAVLLTGGTLFFSQFLAWDDSGEMGRPGRETEGETSRPPRWRAFLSFLCCPRSQAFGD